MRDRIIGAAILVVAVTLAVPALCYAATSAPATRSAPATGSYELDFTLPTAGKSGCTVCHADPNLVKASADVTSSLFVDPATMSKGPHASTPCTGCHVDFAYQTPHANVVKSGGWREIANTACKNCHPDQYSVMTQGAHSPVARPGATTVSSSVEITRTPTCGECHGGHDVLSSAEMTSSVAFRVSGMEMCGQCHESYSATYMDYYHGAAYRNGAGDAPACWDCHTAHGPLAVDARGSSVGESMLGETCAQTGCHKDVNDGFLSYAALVHGTSKVKEANPLWALRDSVLKAVGSALDSVASLFDGE